ncbi:MAG: DUF86 domain-containing protein [Candidatus Glassbacteria bacterium]|nr:DUF86 domain-containing protein [Candidatus Glassbacteria bacterium]
MNRDELYLRHILESIEKIESYAAAGKDEFIRQSHWHDAAIRNFEVIGEATKRLSEEFKGARPGIPWKNITGFRDILIHNYMGVDLLAVWNVIEKELPDLKRVIKSGLLSS